MDTQCDQTLTRKTLIIVIPVLLIGLQIFQAQNYVGGNENKIPIYVIVGL
jgi:hypothetical protein